MKTTITIPDDIFRRAKTLAAQQKISLSRFVTDALIEKLKMKQCRTAKAKLQGLVGGLSHLRKETARINRIIEQEFERIED